MKRGIAITLSAAWMLCICLFTSFNHAVVITGLHKRGDTAYYFNERGRLIGCDVLAKKPGNFVIKTCKRPYELYNDWFRRNPETTDTSYQPACVRFIEKRKAKEVERLIRMGYFNDTAVKNNVVPILDRTTIKKMCDSIMDSGRSTKDTIDFKEYGGLIRYDSTLTLQKGEKVNPCDKKRPTIKIDGNGIGTYHSHPSGENGDCSFIQAPSLDDQHEVKGGIHYVFGMNSEYSHYIYIYDSTGVKATLPFRFMKRKSIK